MRSIVEDLSFSSIIFGIRSVKAASDEKSQCKLEPIIVDGKKLKPCCACPETKRARDACIIERGEENCGKLIEEHKQCMRKLGFKI